jgi:uncharacterized protein YeeX (DUF496 family)
MNMSTGFCTVAVGYDIMDRDNKIQSLLKKIMWLENIVQKCIDIDQLINGLDVKDIDVKVRDNLSLVEVLKGKLQYDKLITKSDMSSCNEILKYMKRKYKFNIDWRGDIVDCELYTKLIMNQER